MLISSDAPRSALFTQSGSASIGLAIEINCASPRLRISSAVSGMLIRFEAATGMSTCFSSLPVMSTKAARGTEVTMVGTRDSCHPMSVLMIVAPAASTSFANETISSQV